MTAETQEKWLNRFALTTTFLAVCAAIGSLHVSSYSTKVQLATTKENNKWAHFQSKSIKQHVLEVENDLLDIELMKDNSRTVKAQIQEKINDLEGHIARYDKEKAEIKAEAEATTEKQVILQKHGGSFGISVMFFQIGIMLSAIGSLLKQRSSWLCGLAIGLFGIVYFINGFLLIF